MNEDYRVLSGLAWGAVVGQYVYFLFDRARDFPGMSDEEILAVLRKPVGLGFAQSKDAAQ